VIATIFSSENGPGFATHGIMMWAPIGIFFIFAPVR
jgi:hypothetical protein